MPQFLFAIVVLVVFNVWPELDLMASNHFFDVAQGFVWRDSWPVLLIYRGVNVLGSLYGLVLLAMLLWACVYWQRRTHMRIKAVYLVLALVIGPGLVTHSLLKDQWGRPRPVQTEVYGGLQPFVPAGRMSDFCEKNCSFVSGHAAMGFYLLAFGFVFPRYRRRWHVVGVAAGLGVGAVRMMQGKHFLSDVLCTYVVVWGCSVLVHQLMTRYGDVDLRRSLRRGFALLVGVRKAAPVTAGATGLPDRRPQAGA